MLIALENKKGIFQKDFLLRIDSLSKDLAQIDEITQVVSPTNLKTVSLGGLVPVKTSVLHFEDESLYKEDSLLIYQSPYWVGSFFPLNAKSLSIFLKTTDDLSKKSSDTLANRIERVLGRYKFDDVHYAGRIFAQNVYLQNIQKEFLVFLCLSFVLVVTFPLCSRTFV